jgi:hypothetical protein
MSYFVSLVLPSRPSRWSKLVVPGPNTFETGSSLTKSKQLLDSAPTHLAAKNTKLVL